MDLNVIQNQIKAKKTLIQEKRSALEKEQEELDRMQQELDKMQAMAIELGKMAMSMFSPKTAETGHVVVPMPGESPQATAKREEYFQTIERNKKLFRDFILKCPMQPMGSTEISRVSGIRMGTVSAYLKEKNGIYRTPEGKWFYDPNRDPNRKPNMDFGMFKKAG